MHTRYPRNAGRHIARNERIDYLFCEVRQTFFGAGRGSNTESLRIMVIGTIQVFRELRNLVEF
jgi:hypothetical protein